MSRTINLTWTELRAKDAKEAVRYAAAKAKNLVPAITYGNANTQGFYKGNNMGSPRAGADTHFEHASLGPGAQINVRSTPNPVKRTKKGTSHE